MRRQEAAKNPAVKFHGSDRDAGAIRMSLANAARAGVTDITEFQQLTVSDLTSPSGSLGLVIINPPYGARIGETKSLQPLYRSLGNVLRERFQGWRIGLVTSEASLAKATGLPFATPFAPVIHGGLRVTLYLTRALI
jgi:putative N6-adenine-specific DNA methylase